MVRWMSAVLLALTVERAAAAPADWTQFGFDARHGAWNTQETAIHTGNVGTLHVLYHVTLPSIADGAPAYLSGVSTAQGLKDLLFLTTKDGRILALDAATGGTVWSAQPATGPMFTTSSPAVDPNRLYVYSYGLDGKAHKYQTGDGAEIVTGGWPQAATLKPQLEKGSSALSVFTTPAGKSYLWVANGGYPNDAGDYQGHVTVIDLASGAQRVFNTMCSDQGVHFVTNGMPDCPDVQGAVWARPGVVYDPDNGLVYFATGNGLFNAAAGGHDWGDSILALQADGSGLAAGMPADSYTPSNNQQLDTNDLDLGSSAPAILPVPAGCNVAHLAAHVGKDLTIRLLNLDNLSGMGGPGHVAGELSTVALPQGGEVLQQPAVWVNPADNATWLFIVNYNGISALKLGLDGSGNPVLTPMWMHGISGTSAVVANGILFYEGLGTGVGVLALDPTTGNQLWHDTSIGNLHWESAVVAGGKLFASDETATLWAYGPDPAPLALYTVTPCRVVDTRLAAGPYGGPPLAGGSRRLFQLAGQCGVPADAQAVAANLTVVSSTSAGALRVAPSGVVTDTSSIAFKTGQTRANNAILELTGNPLGTVAVQTDLPAGETVQFILDVSGYLK